MGLGGGQNMLGGQKAMSQLLAGRGGPLWGCRVCVAIRGRGCSQRPRAEPIKEPVQLVWPFLTAFYLIFFHLETGYGFHTVPYIPYVVLLELALQLLPVCLFIFSQPHSQLPLCTLQQLSVTVPKCLLLRLADLLSHRCSSVYCLQSTSLS